jgi:hypothetical protein
MHNFNKYIHMSKWPLIEFNCYDRAIGYPVACPNASIKEIFMAFTAWFFTLVPASVPLAVTMADIRLQPDYCAMCPCTIQANSQTYERQINYYAVHYGQPQAAIPGAVMQLNDGAIAVFSGTPPSTISAMIGPVYATPSGGGVVVPTGQVFIEFATNETVQQHLAAIEQAGYVIHHSLSYAPNAAWLTAKSGQITDALSRLVPLRLIPQVVTVEPEMLMPVGKR